MEKRIREKISERCTIEQLAEHGDLRGQQALMHCRRLRGGSLKDPLENSRLCSVVALINTSMSERRDLLGTERRRTLW